MRLIDAEALYNKIDTWGCNDYDKHDFLEAIDNAPTVTPTLQLKDITDEDVARFAMIWQRATSKGVILEPERPHGKWIEVPVKRDILHPNGIKYVCSACKRGNCYGKPPFCMWCGATMKSEEGNK